jgi:hypothetical protein
MSSFDVVQAAADPDFYTRVSFLAVKTAQNVASEDPTASNHEARVQYANRVFRGDDGAALLAQHVATNPAIAAALETGGPSAVPDGDIEFALASIWDARANAFYTPPIDPSPPMR